MGKGCRVIQSDCDPSAADDSSLPNNAFLVEYLQDGITKFDLVTAAKRVDIFDDYWDKYQSDFKNITQAAGKISPKLWNNPADKKK